MAARDIGVRELARRVHYNPGHISNLRTGRSRPSPELAADLDTALGAGGVLVTLAPPRQQLTRADDGDLELIELARQVEASDVGSGTIELLQTATDGLARQYTTAEPTGVAASARRHLRYVTGLIGKRATLTQHRDLLVIAGWLSAVIACASYDAGDTASAATATRMTRQFGETAEHAELTAWSFEIAAWFALTEGRFADAAALCDAGIERAGTSNAGVQLAVQTARAHARMGDRQALDALATARTTLRRLAGTGDPQNHFVFDASKFEFYVGTVLAWLGTDDQAAVSHARWVIAECQQDGAVRWPMRLAISQLDLALIAARRGDLDEAVALGHAALLPARRSAQLLPRATELGHELTCRYPGERLTGNYVDALGEERRALTPNAARHLDDAIARRALA